MLLLISDSNILIDIEVAGLTASMFSLEYRFALPDVLFYEELKASHGHLRDMGLEVHKLDEPTIASFEVLAQRYVRPSRMDLLALALAMRERCALLTGDKALRAAAQNEQVQVHGTLWLVTEMLLAGTVTPNVARTAFQRMRARGRRLPWDIVESILAEIEAEQPPTPDGLDVAAVVE